MKISSVSRIAVALIATAGAAALLGQPGWLTARAQESSPAPTAEIQYGNPPPPHCGPGEYGVTKDGRACGGGPIIVKSLPAQTEEERQQERKNLSTFFETHPDAWRARNWAHDVCKMNPETCANIGGGGPVAPPGRQEEEWIDPETHQGYIVDPKTGAATLETPEVSAPPQTPQATPSPDPESRSGRPDSMWLGDSYSGMPCPSDMSLQTNPSTDLVMHVNDGIFFYNTNHNLIFPSQSEYSFWCTATDQETGGALPDCSNDPPPFDTQVGFDPINDRWVLTALSSSASYLYIATSSEDLGNGPEGTQHWAYYWEPACSNFTIGSGIIGDEDILALTSKRAVVDVQFCNTANSLSPNADTVLDFDLSTLETFSTSDPLLKTFNPTGTGGSAIYRVRPAENWSSFDGNSNNGWLAAARFDVNGSNTGSFIDLLNLNYGSPDTLTDYKTYPVDSGAASIIPNGPQSGSSYLIDTGHPDPTSVFVIDNSNDNHTYLFATFAAGVRGSSTSRIDLFALNTYNGTTATKAVSFSSDVASYPSLAANRGQGLYLNYQNFGSTHGPQSQTNFYYYYPLANGLRLQASGQLTNSTSPYTYCVDSVGTVRWGDYTATSYIWPTGSTWTARFFLLDQYATSSSNISLQITGLVPPGT